MTGRGTGLFAWLALVTALAMLAWSPRARAGIADAPGADLTVSLITYGPGAVYWERFGHDAIQIRDRVSGQAVNFNYGVFDFSQKDFLLNFARGYMRYSMDAEPAAGEIAWYIDQGRSVRQQQLNLTPAQAAALRDYLLWNLRPENRAYRYDYYRRNCATRVRDALDQALGGILKARLDQPSHRITYRRQTDRLMAAQPWWMLAMDLGLSGYADQPLSRWQAGFIPMQLAQELSRIRLPNGQPLVIRDRMLAPSRIARPPAQPPTLLWPLLATGLVMALLLLAGDHWRRRSRLAQAGYGTLASAWLLFAGVAGLALAILWGLTQHHAAWANENLLLFNPLALGLLSTVWRRRCTRLGRVLVLALAACALIALLVKGVPGFTQQNLPWIAFGLPPWLALCYTLLRQARSKSPSAARA